MGLEYFIPRQLLEVDFPKPQTLTQDPNGMLNGFDTQLHNLAGESNNFLHKPTAMGVGGMYIRAFNYTDKPIVMIDANNVAIILDPQQRVGMNDRYGSELIVVDVIQLNQDAHVSPRGLDYLAKRREAFTGLECTSPAIDTYSENYVLKSNQNRLYRYNLDGSDTRFNQYEGAFFFEEAGVVFGTIEDVNKVLVHPKASDVHLMKSHPKLADVKSLGSEIGVNDPDHKYERLFTVVYGVVKEVPISRNRTLPSGITYWENVHQKNSAPLFSELDIANVPIKLYTSIAEAETGGSPEKAIELEVIREKIKLQQNKATADREEHDRVLQKAELDRQAAKEKAEHDRETARLKAEQDAKLREEDLKYRERESKRKADEERNREKVENISFWRKVLVEGVKTITTIASVAALALGWYIKQKATAAT